MRQVAIVGGGPAGLMAAERLAGRGLAVTLYDAMPTVGRKFLMAGRGGLNITHSEPLPAFIGRYGSRAGRLAGQLERFGPAQLRDWVHGLGIDTFVGTSGRVFPAEMKAAPLLRAWLHRLRGQGVRLAPRHRWLGWASDAAGPCQQLRFATPDGEVMLAADAVVLALGGGSWRKLGSDGAWVDALAARGVPVAPLRPANCGFIAAWSEFFRQRFAGAAVKSVRGTAGGASVPGDFNITERGVEGGLVYALSAPLRDALGEGGAVLHLDLAPGRSLERLEADLSRPRGRDTLANHLRRRAGLEGVKAALLRECLPAESFADMAALARGIKALPLRLDDTCPIDEAISTAGGVDFAALDERLMLSAFPGVFLAGEMLDWEAPTGGYLLTACLATGFAAGEGAADWLAGWPAAA